MSVSKIIPRLLPCLRLIHPGLRQPRRYCASYDGPGKTTVSILNEDTNYLMVNSFSRSSFMLNNKMKVVGPMIIFPNAVLSWRVETVRDITEDSLIIFLLLDPRPDVILVGYGSRLLLTSDMTEIEKEERKEISAKLAKLTIFMRSKGLNIECVPTEDAIANYNYLCAEDRLVAAALIPPSSVKYLSLDHAMYGERERQLLYKQPDVKEDD